MSEYINRWSKAYCERHEKDFVVKCGEQYLAFDGTLGSIRIAKHYATEYEGNLTIALLEQAELAGSLVAQRRHWESEKKKLHSTIAGLKNLAKPAALSSSCDIVADARLLWLNGDKSQPQPDVNILDDKLSARARNVLHRAISSGEMERFEDMLNKDFLLSLTNCGLVTANEITSWAVERMESCAS